ncbi:MAG TPA: hypothetical protein VH539_12740, partial [Gemmatimonadaceae bacterium]
MFQKVTQQTPPRVIQDCRRRLALTTRHREELDMDVTERDQLEAAGSRHGFVEPVMRALESRHPDQYFAEQRTWRSTES